MRVAKRGRVLPCSDQAGEMRHVDEKQRFDFVADRAESREVEMSRISRATRDNHLRPMLFRQSLELLEVDQMVVGPDAILDGVEPFARLGRRGAMGEVAARGEAETHDGVAGLQEGHHHRAVGLGARMRLDVGELAAEQFLGALDGERFDRVRRRAALVVSPTRVAFGIFVGEHRALRLEDRAADDILRRDELDLGLLALELGADCILDRWVGLGQPPRKEAVRNAITGVSVQICSRCH